MESEPIGSEQMGTDHKQYKCFQHSVKRLASCKIVSECIEKIWERIKLVKGTGYDVNS